MLAGAVAPFLDDSLLDSVSNHLISKLQEGGLKPDAARTYVQGLGAISRAVGYRCAVLWLGHMHSSWRCLLPFAALTPHM